MPQAVVGQTSHQDTYVVEVCRSNALIPVNRSLTAFALQDYDNFLRQLKVQYVIFDMHIMLQNPHTNLYTDYV